MTYVEFVERYSRDRSIIHCHIFRHTGRVLAILCPAMMAQVKPVSGRQGHFTAMVGAAIAFPKKGDVIECPDRSRYVIMESLPQSRGLFKVWMVYSPRPTPKPVLIPID